MSPNLSFSLLAESCLATAGNFAQNSMELTGLTRNEGGYNFPQLNCTAVRLGTRRRPKSGRYTTLDRLHERFEIDEIPGPSPLFGVDREVNSPAYGLQRSGSQGRMNPFQYPD